MNLEDTTQINRASLVKQHILDWKAWSLKRSIHECDDERLLAGCYLSWARGDLSHAIAAVASHCSGQYIDRPAFSKCEETLSYLRNLQELITAMS